MADIVSALQNMSLKFNITELHKYQKLAIRKFVLEDKEVFVNLPTGSGKSLIYQGLPVIFDTITRTSGHIVAVLSPLLNLINDQVNHLNCLGIRAVNLSNVKNEEERIMVEHGAFAIVYGTPEAWLKNERWRDMLHNSVYSEKLCAIAIDEAHVLKQW